MNVTVISESALKQYFCFPSDKGASLKAKVGPNRLLFIGNEEVADDKYLSSYGKGQLLVSSVPRDEEELAEIELELLEKLEKYEIEELENSDEASEDIETLIEQRDSLLREKEAVKSKEKQAWKLLKIFSEQCSVKGELERKLEEVSKNKEKLNEISNSLTSEIRVS